MERTLASPSAYSAAALLLIEPLDAYSMVLTEVVRSLTSEVSEATVRGTRERAHGDNAVINPAMYKRRIDPGEGVDRLCSRVWDKVSCVSYRNTPKSDDKSCSFDCFRWIIEECMYLLLMLVMGSLEYPCTVLRMHAHTTNVHRIHCLILLVLY